MPPETSVGELPASRDGSESSWLNLGPRFYFTFGAGFVLWICWLRVSPYWRQYREIQHRKAMRRRHGIPDNDHRPFNVAYAAATRARKQLEADARRPRRESVDSQGPITNTGNHTRVVPATHRNTRPRSGHLESHDIYQPYSNSASGSGSFSNQNMMSDDLLRGSNLRGGSHALFSEEQHTAVPSGVVPKIPGRLTRRSRLSTLSTYGKHALEDEGVVTDTMKSRMGDTELVGEGSHLERDAGAELQDIRMEIDEDAFGATRRGSKRSASGEDGDIEGAHVRSRDKRLRKVSGGKSEDQEMHDADADWEPTTIPRGKKRDRGEAGSVFGGEESSADGDGDERRRRHTRRRTTSQKKTSASSRGQKRGRDVIDPLDSEEGSSQPTKRTMRQRYERRASSDSDSSLDDGMVSYDSLCKGRRIGEEWEVNGILYKVGPNGQRLRQALVKRSRTRFPMPKDSEHPDRSAHIDVFVETWLSEDQYQEAKERHELAWQESSRQSTAEPEVPGDADGTSRVGKNLLWSSAIVKESPAPQRRPFRLSAVSNVGLRVNPPEQSQIVPGRRISSIQAVPTLPPDSPKLRGSKSYSKWEKQDLEAIAMAKLREKAQRQAATPTEKSTSSVMFPLINAPISDKGGASLLPVEAASKTSSEVPKAPGGFVSSGSLAPVSHPALAATPSDLSKPASNPLPTPTAVPVATLPAVVASKPGGAAAGATSGFSFTATPGTTAVPVAPSTISGPPPLNAPTFFGPSPATLVAQLPKPAPPSDTPNIFAPKSTSSHPPSTQSPATLTTTPASSTIPNPFGLNSQSQSSTPTTTAPIINSNQTSAIPSFSFKPTPPPSGTQPTTLFSFGNGMVNQFKQGAAPSSSFGISSAVKDEQPRLAENPISRPQIDNFGSQPQGMTTAPKPPAPFTFAKSSGPMNPVNHDKPSESGLGSSAVPPTTSTHPVKFNFFGTSSTNPTPSANPTALADPSKLGSAGSFAFGTFGSNGNALGVPAVGSTTPTSSSATAPNAAPQKATTPFTFGINSAINAPVPTTSSIFGDANGSNISSGISLAAGSDGPVVQGPSTTSQKSMQPQPVFSGFGSTTAGNQGQPTAITPKTQEGENKMTAPFKFNFGTTATLAPNAPTFGPASFSATPAANGTQPNLNAFGFGNSSTPSASTSAFTFGASNATSNPK